jgi:hypothetical protein
MPETLQKLRLGNKEIVTDERQFPDFTHLLEKYMDQPIKPGAEALEKALEQAAEKHAQDPRAYGPRFAKALMEVSDPAEFKRQAENGIRLNILLDRLAFPSQKPDEPARVGWPKQKYFPDGFSFLAYSSDTQRDSDSIFGEKLRLDKLALLKALPAEKFYPLLQDVCDLLKKIPRSTDGRYEITDIEMLRPIYQKISTFLHDVFKQPDMRESFSPLESQSVPIHQFVEKGSAAECRHYEFVAQFLEQTLGLPGELLNCHMFVSQDLRGNHLATRIVGQNQDYLVDFTNPDSDGNVFITPIAKADADVDLNKVLWSGKRKLGPPGGMNIMYLTKYLPSQVHYRILHGWT